LSQINLDYYVGSLKTYSFYSTKTTREQLKYLSIIFNAIATQDSDGNYQ